ncbi:MAG: cbb3-type cytochrome c oxidase subunit I [Nannocystaceae bacterium]
MINTDPTRRYATLTFLRGAALALAITLLGGLLGSLYSVPSLAPAMKALGLDLRSLRPLHTVFAASFIFLGGVAVVHRYFQEVAGPMTKGDRLRLKAQLVLWAVAGIGIFCTLLAGITSGREYLGFHPVFSVPILLGWLCFVWTFFRITGRDFWHRPIYVTMWGVGCVFFIYTFTEQHAWLLPEVFADPLVDRRVQWKACGTLVGTFNLFVYGSLIYAKEKISGDEGYAQSRIAYSLFAVSMLNSFTNFAHHTYHLPQGHVIKWIAFVVSMLEIIIFCRVAFDVARSVAQRASRNKNCATSAFFTAVSWWSMMMLFTSLLISVPPLNALLHGTYAITGHAMGTMIGIDTLVLAGCITWLLLERLADGARGALGYRSLRWIVVGINVSVGGLVLWLHLVGVTDGVHRYLTPRGLPYAPYRPQWLAMSSGIVFAVTGTAVFFYFSALLRVWTRLLIRDASAVGPTPPDPRLPHRGERVRVPERSDEASVREPG